ncbi:MAG: hypothetical protein Q7T71_14530, partial [Herbiconiux sp.]|nr:hypothetical protein [Herbiconiux sp.]
MTLIRIDPVAVRQAGLGAVQTTDGLQDQAGQLRALEIPPMPAAMAAKYDTGLDDVAAMLVRAGGILGPAGIELQVRAAAAVTTDSAGGVGADNAGTVLERSIITTVVLPGGGTASTKIKATATGEVASATVAPAGLKFTLAGVASVPVGPTDPADLKPDQTSSKPTGDATTKTSTTATERAATERTSGQPVTHGEPVSGRPAAAVANAVYGDPAGAGAPA